MLIELYNFITIVYAIWVDMLMSNPAVLAGLNICLATFAVWYVVKNRHLID